MKKRVIAAFLVVLIVLGFWALSALDLSLEELRGFVDDAQSWRDQNAAHLNKSANRDDGCVRDFGNEDASEIAQAVNLPKVALYTLTNWSRAALYI